MATKPIALCAYKDCSWKCAVYACSNIFTERIKVSQKHIQNPMLICEDCLKNGWRFYPGHVLPLKRKLK
jgi:hypothetical protein